MNTRDLLSALRLLFSRAIGSFGNFFLVALTARLFGQEASGVLFVALSLGIVTAFVGNLGLRRFTFSNASSLDSIVGPVRLLALVAASFLCLAGGVALLAIDRTNIVAVAAASGVLFGGSHALTVCEADLMKAKGKTQRGLLLEFTMVPWSAIVISLALHYFGRGGEYAPLIALVSASVVVAVSVFPIGSVAKSVMESPIDSAMSVGALMSRSELRWFWLSGLGSILLGRMTGVIAPGFLDASELGVLALVLSLASVGGTILQTLQARYVPQLARAYASSMYREFNAVAARARWIATAAFGLFALPVLVAPITIFDLLFQVDDPRLVEVCYLIVGAQAVRCLFGVAELALSVSGHWRAEFLVMLCALSVYVVTGLSLSAYSPLIALSAAHGASLVLRGVSSQVLLAWGLRADMRLPVPLQEPL